VCTGLTLASWVALCWLCFVQLLVYSKDGRFWVKVLCRMVTHRPDDGGTKDFVKPIPVQMALKPRTQLTTMKTSNPAVKNVIL
jgi:hypothetical protein